MLDSDRYHPQEVGMPFYEYKCRKCGAEFEELISISHREREEQKLACPECGARGPERQLSTFAALSSQNSGPAACPHAGTPTCPSGG